MFIEVRLRSLPANVTVASNQLYIPHGVNATAMAAKRELLKKVLPGALLAGLLVIFILACLVIGCAEKRQRRNSQTG